MRAAAVAPVLALGLVLAACATRAEREVARMNQATAVALADMAACSLRAEASPPYRALKSRLPPTDGTEPSPALLADSARPTPAEAVLLVELHTSYITPCRKLVVERLDTINPAFAEVTARSFAEADAEYAKLVRRDESWGDYAQAYVRRREAFTRAFSAAGDEINRNLAQLHVLELQKRQAAAAAISDWQAQQPAIAGAVGR